jgi:hypothetical protein
VRIYTNIIVVHVWNPSHTNLIKEQQEVIKPCEIHFSTTGVCGKNTAEWEKDLVMSTTEEIELGNRVDFITKLQCSGADQGICVGDQTLDFVNCMWKMRARGAIEAVPVWDLGGAVGPPPQKSLPFDNSLEPKWEFWEDFYWLCIFRLWRKGSWTPL